MDANALKNVAISMRCHNTPGQNHFLTVPFVYTQTTADGLGHASSHKVQFNVNKDAVPGTIFVDKNNDGICIATITSNHIIKDGWVAFDPEGSSTDDSGTKPNDINQSVNVTRTLTSNKDIKFSVHRIGVHKGNITLTFFVTYEAAI